MTRTLLGLGLIAPALLLQPGCNLLGDGQDCDETPFLCTSGSGTTDTLDTGPTDSDADTDADADSDTDADGDSDADADTGYMDDPGDSYGIKPSDAYVPLIDASGDPNTEQEFFAVIVNTTDAELGFRLSYSSSGEGESAEDTGLGGTGTEEPGEGQGASGEEEGEGETAPSGPSAPTSTSIPWTMPEFGKRAHGLTAPASGGTGATGTDTGDSCELLCADIGTCKEEFIVRSDFTNSEDYDTVRATLWAVGESVTLWVDDRAPIDWDYDCDGEIDAEASNPAYGFDNCDLNTVADIVDTNIVVNFRELFGDESDINNDCRVSVLITPVLNELPRSSSDDDDHDSIVGSYADPAVDLDDFDVNSNPMSDEQELIYVFAPDPHGFYNPSKTASVEEYTSQELVGQIARGFYKLISYNHHVIVNGGDAEEGWLDRTMAAVGTDIVGFGATYYDDAWVYLDAPNMYALSPLATSDNDGFFSTRTKGAEYLFGRWLVDKYGTGILSLITQSSTTSVDAIEKATSDLPDVDQAEFDDLALEFHVALFASGVVDTDGAPLVDVATNAPFADASTISAPTTPPTDGNAGQFYGANGYQTGFNIRGTNSFYEDGTTASPSENLSRRVVTNGSDFQIYVPGFPFYGYSIGGHSAFVTRLVDVPYEAAYLEIQGGSDSILGTVIRWFDPESTDYAVEQIYSAFDANSVALPALPDNGDEIYALGEITDGATTSVIDSTGESSTDDVADTDRWLLDLTDRPSSAIVSMAIWLERKFENSSGDATPYDPWIAIVPEADVPTPTVDDFHYDSSCATADAWAYPNLVITSVFDQYYLKDSAGVGSDGGDFADKEESEFCGKSDTEADSPGDSGDSGLGTGAPACDSDWDGDGISEDNEPAPSSFAEQVITQQCTNNGGTLDGVDILDEDAFDADERDEDDIVGFSTLYNVGGTAVDGGEEALLYATLSGGQRYILVVSGGGDTGFYELSMRQLN